MDAERKIWRCSLSPWGGERPCTPKDQIHVNTHMASGRCGWGQVESVSRMCGCRSCISVTLVGGSH